MRIGIVLPVVAALLAVAAPAHAGELGYSCALTAKAKSVRLTQGAPKQELIDALGVLRRPRTSLDFLPGYGRATALERLHLRYVRRTPGEVGADQHYVVTGNFPRPPVRPPRRCLRDVPADVRRAFIRDWRELARRPTDALCLVEYQGDGRYLRDSCVSDPVESLRQGLVVGPARTRARLTQAAGIVPDGVAAVEAHYATGPLRRATVMDNVWSLGDLRRADRLEPRTLIWLDAAGAEVKRVPFSR